MTKDEALARLNAIIERQKPDARPVSDEEQDHGEADAILLDLIDDDDVTAAFEAINKWYS